mmetsp:Transcript_68167/g.210732  ORF Transcript_68167/g.210732 Transcript_68167/m.210732 type:complete len:294 (+) Transcript_68167:493-1374(+)
MVLQGLGVLSGVKVLGEDQREVVRLHAVGQAEHALAALLVEQVVRHVVVDKVEECLDPRPGRDLGSALGDREARGEPCHRPCAEARLQLVKALLEDGLLLVAVHLGVAGGVVDAVRAELPAGLLEGLGHELQLRRVAVDDGSGRDAEGLEHVREALETTAIAVVAPTFVGHLGDGLQVRLDGRTSTTRHEDLHVDDRHNEYARFAAPAALHLLPKHARSVVAGYRRHGGRHVAEAVLADEGAGVLELEGEVPVIRQAQLEAVAVVHRRRRAHRGQSCDDLLGVQDEARDGRAA